MAVLAWLRRLIVSIGIGGTSYAIMLGIMVLSVVYDQQLEPIIAVAFDTGRSIVGAFELVGVRESLGTGGGEPPARAGQHDPCRALHSGYRHRRHRRWHSFQLASRGDTDRGSADCHSARERPGHRRACRCAVHVQRPNPGRVCGPPPLRRLDLAGVLRHHGAVQCARLVYRHRALRVSIETETT